MPSRWSFRHYAALSFVAIGVLTFFHFSQDTSSERKLVLKSSSLELFQRYSRDGWNTSLALSCISRTRSSVSIPQPSETRECTSKFDVAILSFDDIPQETFDDTVMYLWLGILGAPSMETPKVTVGCVTFHMAGHNFEIAKKFRNILAAGGRWQFRDTLPPSLSALPPQEHSIGLLLKGSESCLPPCGVYGSKCLHDPIMRAKSSSPFAFGLHVYQDCLLLDNRRFFQFPLGPSIFTGFPATPAGMAHLLGRPVPDVASRPNILFSMVSGPFDEKYGRREAVVAATRVCRRARCQVQSWADRAYFYVGKALEMLMPSRREHPARYSATQRMTYSYAQGLAHSVFTLCPSGKNPESYRIYEAILAGSIPIIHNASIAGNSMSTCPDQFEFLQRLHAPVLFVQDWSELDAVLAPYIASPALAQRLQTSMLAWYSDRFVPHLRNLAVHLVETHMDSTS
jgi:hypothetical protein